MATKKIGKSAKKLAQIKIDHPPYYKTNIPAGMAAPAPPLGPNIGQRGIQIGPFVKQFNDMTKDYIRGIPLPTLITVKPDRTFDITLYTPPMSYFLKRASGMRKGSPIATDVSGKVSLKHVYEIAKIKSSDPSFRNVPLKEICKQVICNAHSIGVEVVRDMDPEEYGKFLEIQKIKDKEIQDKLDEIRQAKLLRL